MFHKRSLLLFTPVEHTKLRSCTSVIILLGFLGLSKTRPFAILVYPFKYSINDPKECFRLASCTARGPRLYRYDQECDFENF